MLADQLPVDDSGVTNGPADYITVLEGADSATLMVAKSLLLDAGIPFIAQGEKLQDLVEPGRMGTNFSIPLGTVKLQVQAEDADEAREILRIEDKPGSEKRVQELERNLMGEVIWCTLFLLAGLALAYIIVPGTWDEGVRILIYATASICSAFLGLAIRKSRGYDQVAEEKPASENEEPTQPSTDKRKYILVIAILALSILFLFYYYGTNTERGTSNNISTNEIKKDLEYYKKAIAQNPNNVSYHYSAGTAYLMLKSPREALPYLNRAIELDPTCVDCYKNRAVAHYRLGSYDQTIKDESRIIDLDPHHAKITDAYHGRADAFYADHQYWQAIKDYDKTIDLDPQRIEAYLSRGNTYATFLNDYKRAIRDYDKAIELDPKNARAYAVRGHAYSEIGQYNEALNNFERGIELNSKDPWVCNNFAWFLATCKDGKYRDGKKAVHLAKQAVELAEKSSDDKLGDYHDTLAAAHAEVGDYDKAILTQSKACELYKVGNSDDETQSECKQLIEVYKGKQPYIQWESKNRERK